jgi:hypothetical protein
MITDNNKKLAQWAMDYALKNGCQAAKLVLYSNSNASFELRDAKMDRLQQASESGLSISLYVDGRYGSYSTNRLDKKELETFIKNGIESTRYLAVDEARVLPDASRYYKGGKPDLQLFDKRFETINPDDKVAIARAAAEEVLGKDSRIISVGTSYVDGESSSYRLTSNGFEGESKSTWFSVSADVALRGEGEARPSSYWYESALFYDKLVKSGVGTKALERVLRKLGQKKVAYPQYNGGIQKGELPLITEQPMRLSLLMPHLNFFCQKTLQFLGTQAQIKLPFVGYRNRACFFRYNDCMGIRHLRYSHRCTMPQTQFFRNVQIVRHGQDTSCRLNALLADNHSSVVQRTILEKDIFYQALVYIGVDNLPCTHHIVQRHIMFHHNQCTDFLLAHTDTSHYNGHNFIVFHTFFLVSRKEAHQRTGMLMRTERKQKPPYFILKQDDKCQHAHADQFIKNRP